MAIEDSGDLRVNDQEASDCAGNLRLEFVKRVGDKAVFRPVFEAQDLPEIRVTDLIVEEKLEEHE